ncbi:MAG: hypothetical protein LBR08_12975 [Bacteroidales bacterium]|nr:hypothetical protein [Bacteroidales bacterium]
MPTAKGTPCKTDIPPVSIPERAAGCGRASTNAGCGYALSGGRHPTQLPA